MRKFLSVFLLLGLLSIIPTLFADSVEDHKAYERAYGEFMTTMDSFERFRFEDGVTRQEAAKFLVMGAEALDLEISSDQQCDFQDLGNADPSLIAFVNEGCRDGIFKAQTNFQPFDTLTRAQAELTIARLLKGYDAVNAYAADHSLGEFQAARQILKEEGVVKHDIDPDSSVRRGHLLLMLYRIPEAGLIR